jgi:hypothetical protein
MYVAENVAHLLECNGYYILQRLLAYGLCRKLQLIGNSLIIRSLNDIQGVSKFANSEFRAW